MARAWPSANPFSSSAWNDTLALLNRIRRFPGSDGGMSRWEVIPSGETASERGVGILTAIKERTPDARDYVRLPPALCGSYIAS